MEEIGGSRGRGRRGAASGRDWTKGSIFRNLISLSWPVMVTQSLTTLGPTIDMMWVGKLGAAAIAGVGIAVMVVQLMNVARQGLQMGERALVARFVGAGDKEGAAHVAQQALVITLGFALIVALIGIFLSRQILMLLGVGTDVVDQGAAYLRIQLVGMFAMSLQQMTQSIMQASGDTVTPMKISIGTRLFHATLSPFLIFGWWIFPRLGVSGAALANVLDQAIAGGLGMWVLYSGRSRLRPTLRNFRLDGKIIWRIVKIGIPATLNATERNMANLMVTWFVVPFGTVAVAAHALMQRIDQFIHMPAQGLGQGSGVLAGQNLGAGQPQRAAKTAWLAAALFTAVMAIASVAVWFGAEYVVRLFNSEPGLVVVASTFLRIEIISYMAFGYAQVLQQSLNGVGDTLVPLLITLTTMWLVQMPLAYFLRGTTLGVYGVRWGIVAAIVVRAALYATYFRLGWWQRKKI